MKKKLNMIDYIFLLICLLTTLLFPNKIYANTDYNFEKYDVDIVVNEDNSFDITENITAFFSNKKNGIIKRIPLKNTLVELDGSISKSTTLISNVEINDEYRTFIENSYRVFEIGGKYKEYLGQKNYVIKYNYNVGKDSLDKLDEFYFNIIGDEWDTNISNVTFKITMPKEFDSSKLSFYSKGKKLIDSSQFDYSVDGNIIIGKYLGTLNSFEGITIKIELPEGYFSKAKNARPFLDYLLFLIPLILFILSFNIWKKYGKDTKLKDTIRYYPPKGYNSLEAAYLYNGKVETIDVVSLILYLANKGYIKIVSEKNKSNKERFKLIKLKEYDGDNENERLLFNELFKKSEDLGDESKDIVTRKDFVYSDVVNKISGNLYDKLYKKIIYKNTKKSIFIVFSIILCIFIVFGIPFYENSCFNVKSMPTFLFIIIFLLPFLIFIICMDVPWPMRIISIIFIFIFHINGLFSPEDIVFIMSDKFRFISIILGILYIIIMVILYRYMPKRTEVGSEVFRKIRGFKKFLETSKKEELELLSEKNPLYFYDVLPFAYVLGLSDKWFKKFKSIALKSPDWYESLNEFNFDDFYNFMSITIKSITEDLDPTTSAYTGSFGG